MGPHGRKETTRRMRRSEKGLRPSGRFDSGKRRERCTAWRVAPGHTPSSTRGSGGGLQRSTKKASSSVLFDTVIDGRPCTRSPRWATRFARRASTSAVKGGPLSGKGRGLQRQRPGVCARTPGTMKSAVIIRATSSAREGRGVHGSAIGAFDPVPRSRNADQVEHSPPLQLTHEHAACHADTTAICRSTSEYSGAGFVGDRHKTRLHASRAGNVALTAASWSTTRHWPAAGCTGRARTRSCSAWPATARRARERRRPRRKPRPPRMRVEATRSPPMPLGKMTRETPARPPLRRRPGAMRAARRAERRGRGAGRARRPRRAGVAGCHASPRGTRGRPPLLPLLLARPLVYRRRRRARA
jgi:hypothetical protein